jgi:hypothetical protein
MYNPQIAVARTSAEGIKYKSGVESPVYITTQHVNPVTKSTRAVAIYARIFVKVNQSFL